MLYLLLKEKKKKSEMEKHKYNLSILSSFMEKQFLMQIWWVQYISQGIQRKESAKIYTLMYLFTLKKSKKHYVPWTYKEINSISFQKATELNDHKDVNYFWIHTVLTTIYAFSMEEWLHNHTSVRLKTNTKFKYYKDKF